MKLTESYKRKSYNRIMEALAPIVMEKLNESSVSPKWIEYNKENVEKYKSKGNLLQNAKTGADIFGWIVVKGDKLVGYCACKGDEIIALEVDPKFRKMKYATKFVKKAKEKGCVEVSIEKNNRPAISLYFKNGFYIYGSNKKQLFMKLRGSSKK